MKKRNIDIVLDYYPDDNFLQADGYDGAIIGVNNEKLVYSISKCIEILITRDGMSDEEAIEYFYFNSESAFVGNQTPIWVDDAMFEWEQ